MKTITKKLFNELHKNKKLTGISGGEISKERALECLNNFSKDFNELPTFETSRIDTGNQGDATKTSVYTEQIKGKMFYIVETISDLSKDNYTSRNDVIKSVVVYIGV